MKTAKKLFSIMLAMVMALGLTACGGSASETAEEPQEEQTEQASTDAHLTKSVSVSWYSTKHSMLQQKDSWTQ